MPLKLACSVAGTDKDRARSNTVRQLNIAMAIADHKRPAQIQAVITGGLLQQPRPRLAARACVVSSMRTIVQRVDMRSLFGKLGCYQVVNRSDQRFRKVPPADTGLIRDHD